MTKNVLILTYYWPPAGGPGVQRPLKFAKYLPLYGWNPIILTVANGEYPARDETFLKDIPDDLFVVKTASIEPFTIYRKFTGQRSDETISTFVLTENQGKNFRKRLASAFRGNLFIPDARIGWKPFAVREGCKALKTLNIDLLFSTAPPMTTHLIAKRITTRTSIPWVADFRDPWTDVFYYHTLKRSRLSQYIDKRLESSVLSAADAVVTVSPTIKSLFENKANNSYFVIPNGFDEDDFNIDPLPDDGFVHIIHAGHLAVNQNPVGLWCALRELVEEEKFNTRLRIDFYGSIHTTVKTALIEHNLQPWVTYHDYVSHDDLVAAMKRAALLFFCVPDTSYSKGIPTSKLFDYMGTGVPVLGIGPKDGDAASILNRTGSGSMIAPDDVPSMVSFIKTSVSQGITPSHHTRDYTREHLTKTLASVFDRLCR